MVIMMPAFLYADTNQCADLFNKEFKTSEFNLVITGKKKATQYIDIAYDNLDISTDAVMVNDVLTQIANQGSLSLTPPQKEFILRFRQNISYLRSVFQTSSFKHKSPKEFANFVRDFGHLKDMILIDESEKAQKMANRIVSKYDTLNFNNLLKNVKPATKKSTQKYFKVIIKNTAKILLSTHVTVDELHDVRKNLRDILRYMQIQNEVSSLANGQRPTDYQLGQDDSANDTDQITFLKKTNKQLGKICDDNAALIIQGKLSEDTVIEFPVKLKVRVQHFLENYSFDEN